MNLSKEFKLNRSNPYSRARVDELNYLKEDQNKRNCPVCSIGAELIEHPKGEAFKCNKCKLIFGIRPKGDFKLNNTIAIASAIAKAKNEEKNRLHKENMRVVRADLTYNESIKERRRKKSASQNQSISQPIE